MSCVKAGSKRNRDHHKANSLGPTLEGSYRASEDEVRNVYFLLDREACQIKIGWTQNVKARIRDLTRQRGRPLELLGVLAGDYNLERAMHGRFRQWRVEGREWYSSEIAADVLLILRNG